MERKNTLSIGEYYHVYNRGTDKRVIYNTDHDRRRFLALLYLCNSNEPITVGSRRCLQKGGIFNKVFSAERGETIVDIGAYCLMPNHFHILMYEKRENGISQFMQKLCTAYSMYFNKKNERKGTLFEGPFRSELIDDDSYFNYVFSYIHLNPVSLVSPKWKECGIDDINRTAEFVRGYAHSSYPDYFGDHGASTRPRSKILEPASFPEHFFDIDGVEDLVEMWNESKELVEAAQAAEAVEAAEHREFLNDIEEEEDDDTL